VRKVAVVRERNRARDRLVSRERERGRELQVLRAGSAAAVQARKAKYLDHGAPVLLR
jgi:hypothetical protein